MPIKKEGRDLRPSQAGIVMNGTSSVELRERTGLPNHAGFILSVQRLAIKLSMFRFKFLPEAT